MHPRPIVLQKLCSKRVKFRQTVIYNNNMSFTLQTWKLEYTVFYLLQIPKKKKKT
jgi:hypothetical protein